MKREYLVERKLQEQSGSYFVILPKIWVESYGLKQGDMMSVLFNDDVKIKPPPDPSMLSGEDTGCVPLSESIDVAHAKEVRSNE